MEEAQSAAVAAFFRACGVTVRLEETPQDRFAEPEPWEVPAVRAGPDPVPRPAPDARDVVPEAVAGDGAGDAAVNAAREAARSAPTLAALHASVRAFEGCPLKATARSTCLGEGPEGAALMVVGEAPGRDEDEAGRPFVGRSGMLLERMLAAIGLGRDAVYITNVIPWRPPANRTPSPIETATCEVFVRREVELVRPRVLLLLGGAAAKTLLRTDAGIMRQRGRWERVDTAAGPVDTMATFHPADLLRTPADKKRAWADLLAVRLRLDGRG